MTTALARRTAQAQARDEESFSKARDIARQKYGIDWPAHGFYVVSARDMVLGWPAAASKMRSGKPGCSHDSHPFRRTLARMLC